MQTLILNHKQVMQKLTRIAWQIYERNTQHEQLIIAGISERGYIIADMLCNKLREITPMNVILVKIEVDKENPDAATTKVDSDVATYHKTPLVIVDDVLNSGKTLLYATLPFINKHFQYIQTAVLVNRNHHRYPVFADYVGLSLATTLQEHIEVAYNEAQFEVFLH
jgi:pyrimidine operon attenuation protein/uracil phosphoribosyltransferase